jgi:hypothetical protein
MTANTDRDYYHLLHRLIAARDERIRQYEVSDFPFSIMRRRASSDAIGVRAISFRFKNKEIRRPTLQHFAMLGIPYAPGMLRLIGEITRLDRLIAAMVKTAQRVVARANAICVELVQACEHCQISPGGILMSSCYEFVFAGTYSPLPFLAREIALQGISKALEAASLQILVCNRHRRWNKKMTRQYSPQACPGILIRARKGVLPPYAEWGVYVRRNPKQPYHFVRQLRSKRIRAVMEIGISPTQLQLRYFKLKAHGATFRAMGDFVATVMRIRNRNRTLWEFVRNVPVAKRDLALLHPLNSSLPCR